MRKVYEAPKLEFETYVLNADIASNCAVVVTMGDYGGGVGEPACDDYLIKVGLKDPGTPVGTNAYNVNFWENTCDCYTTAGGPGFFTS